MRCDYIGALCKEHVTPFLKMDFIDGEKQANDKDLGESLEWPHR